MPLSLLRLTDHDLIRLRATMAGGYIVADKKVYLAAEWDNNVVDDIRCSYVGAPLAAIHVYT